MIHTYAHTGFEIFMSAYRLGCSLFDPEQIALYY